MTKRAKAKAFHHSLLAPTRPSSSLLCHDHSQIVEFICTNRSCFRELCGFCILTHKEHIDDIKKVEEVLRSNVELLEESNLDRKKDELVIKQTESLRELDRLSEALRETLNAKINSLKERLVVENDKVANFLSHFARTRQEMGKKKTFGLAGLRCLKDLLRTKKAQRLSKFVIEESLLQNELSKLLSNSVTFASGGVSTNSTGPFVPKILHWFEWEKRDLHLYDVVTYSHRVVKLAIYFKIPSFSRSIITPEGKIFLLGGEDNENGPRRDVFCCSLSQLPGDVTLHPKTPMPSKRYDFALCHHAGFLYVIAGKDGAGHVTNKVERYSIERDTWTVLAPISKKRYAACAAVLAESDKICLFGGRLDTSSQMAEDVEEYDIRTNVWRSIKLPFNTAFEPVEVCAAVQIKPGQILLFGGSDLSVEDSAVSYVFHAAEGHFERVGSLKKGHVFVYLPFAYGNNVFAVGNEYYVKSRNIHRYNITTKKWEILFSDSIMA